MMELDFVLLSKFDITDKIFNMAMKDIVFDNEKVVRNTVTNQIQTHKYKKIQKKDSLTKQVGIFKSFVFVVHITYLSFLPKDGST